MAKKLFKCIEMLGRFLMHLSIKLNSVEIFNKLQDFVVWGQHHAPVYCKPIADGCTLVAESSAMCIVSSLPEHTPGGTAYKWDGYLSGLLV